MISIEPIMGDFTGYDFSQFELVVVGLLFGTMKKVRFDVNSIKHDNIYYKPNATKYLK
jgi:hypothetical protein